MITIDSQIWIYYWDINVKEHKNVKKWLNGIKNDGILFKEKIYLSMIIPIEVGHHLFKLADRNKDLSKDFVEDLILSLITNENCYLIELDAFILVNVIQKLKKYVQLGIGGRDTLILTSMDKMNIKTIATHDKNILTLKEYKRIDPVFDPPLIFEIGEAFNYQEFKLRLNKL
ncbi:MAG: type II toxin-antitoxin system VapC family toxin [Promethearchaeota archaeon]